MYQQQHCFILLKYIGNDDEPYEEVFRHDGTDAGRRDARARMVARMAVARTVEPDTRFEGYAYTSEPLDWVFES